MYNIMFVNVNVSFLKVTQQTTFGNGWVQCDLLE